MLRSILCAVLIFTSRTSAAFAPKSRAKFQSALRECPKLSTDCSKGSHGPIGTWDVSAITDMSTPLVDSGSGIFDSAFNGDISKWDVSKVTNMKRMFGKSLFNGDISEWTVSKVTDMSGMFARAYSFNGDISKWTVSKVTNMENMFYSALKFNGDISKWTVSKVTDMSGMFYFASSFNGDISEWTVSKVTNMKAMFGKASSFNGDISKWTVSKVTNMENMFVSANSFNGDISKWDVSKVTDMSGMFYFASSFNGDISEWTVSKVTDMAGMFTKTKLFNGDISKWDVSKVTDMSGMFYFASSFNGDISKWTVSKVTNMKAMFAKASSFNGDISKWDVSKVTNMYSMFYGAASFVQTLCGAWKASKAVNNGIFSGSSGKVCTTTAATTTTATATTMEAKSSCRLTEWDLSEGELTGTSVTLSLASVAITVNTAHEFAKCIIPGDFKFALYQVDTGNGICSTTAVATGLWTTKKVFEPTPGKKGTTTARVSIVFSPAALAADLQQTNPQIYSSKGGSADKNILSFCVRSTIRVDDYELRFSEMIVSATINTVFAIPAIENINVGRPKAKLATTAMDLLDTVNAYECYKDGNTFKGWVSGESKPALTTQNNILTLCVTGVTTAVECKEFWDLSLKQGSKADDVRVDDGANTKQLVTSVFGVQAIKDPNKVDYKGCAAQLLLDASYFDSAKPEKVTISGSVRVGLAARRRLLRDDRSLHDTKATSFDVDVDRLEGSTSGGATTALTTAVLLVLAATVIV